MKPLLLALLSVLVLCVSACCSRSTEAQSTSIAPVERNIEGNVIWVYPESKRVVFQPNEDQECVVIRNSDVDLAGIKRVLVTYRHLNIADVAGY